MEGKILEQYERVIKGVGLYAEPRDLLQISGRERTSWLQGMVTQDIAKLTQGEGCFTALCGREGKMVGVAVIYAFETYFLLETEKGLGEKIATHLNRYLIAEEVEIKEVTGEWSAMSLFGPETFKLLGRDPLEWFHWAPHSGRQGFLAGNQKLGLEGATLFIPSGERETVQKELHEKGAFLMEQALYEVLRIENGFPKWGKDMAGEELPMEAQLTPIAISYTKGCYLGQEVIQRIKTYGEPPKRLVFLEIEGDSLPPEGTLLKKGSEVIGHVTSSVVSIRAKRPVAMGYVRKEYKEPGTTVEIDGYPEALAHVQKLPWLVSYGTVEDAKQRAQTQR